MDSVDINDYLEQLKDLCDTAKVCHRCRNHDKLCVYKKVAFFMAKNKYLKDVKKV